MTDAELYWQKIAALGQVAGAIATFGAVAVSLWVSIRSRRPRLKIRVGERLIIPGNPWDDNQNVLMFSIANVGDRTVHVNGVGWRTGWFRHGPSYVRRKQAVQMVGSIGLGVEPPFEVQPAAELSCYAAMENLINDSNQRIENPFFTRDWPLVGRRGTTVWGWVSTAEGYTFHVKLEVDARRTLANAEIVAKTGQLSE